MSTKPSRGRVRSARVACPAVLTKNVRRERRRMPPMRPIVRRLATVCALAVSTAVLAQETNPLAFEVASVRPSSGTRLSRRVTETRVDLINYPVRGLLLTALRVPEYQLAAPDWVRDVRIDISATLPAGASRAQVPGMLQDLLRRRFGAEWHIEQRPLQAYELLIGADGHSLREVPPLDELGADPPSDAVAVGGISESVEGPYRNFLTRSGESTGATTVTATTRYTQYATPQGPSLLDAKRMTMDELAMVLQFTVDAPVVNRTGLSGGYEFKIELPRPATARRLLMDSGITSTYHDVPPVLSSVLV